MNAPPFPGLPENRKEGCPFGTNKKDGKCVNTHRPGMGPAPRDWVITILRPVRIPLPTGATALEIHEMNRHSRKNGGNVAKNRREGKAL